MTTAIVQKENKILRKKAGEVPMSEIGSSRISRIIQNMKEALELQQDGVAIAAPQIGEPLRIFIVSKRAFEIEDERLEVPEELRSKHKDLVCINPTIIKLSKQKAWMEEGCLSVRWLYGQVRRSSKATVRAFDENGNIFERGGSGLLSQIFQHECDHLEGTLFIDKAKNVREIPPEQLNENTQA